MVNWIDNTTECEPEHHCWFVITILQGIAWLFCLICRKIEQRKV